MSILKNKYFSYLLFAACILFAACDPSIDADIAIPALPTLPLRVVGEPHLRLRILLLKQML